MQTYKDVKHPAGVFREWSGGWMCRPCLLADAGYEPDPDDTNPDARLSNLPEANAFGPAIVTTLNDEPEFVVETCAGCGQYMHADMQPVEIMLQLTRA